MLDYKEVYARILIRKR